MYSLVLECTPIYSHVLFENFLKISLKVSKVILKFRDKPSGVFRKLYKSLENLGNGLKCFSVDFTIVENFWKKLRESSEVFGKVFF